MSSIKKGLTNEKARDRNGSRDKKEEKMSSINQRLEMKKG
jgi:hypothetical protein